MSSSIGNTGEEQSNTTAPEAEATDTEEPTSESVELPLEEVFDVLRNERRRLVLVYMAAGEGPYSIGDLAEHVASHENDKPVVQLSSDERKRAYVGLYQCHLPKLDSMDIVAFNKARGRVELGPNYHRVEPYLRERSTDSGNDWPRRYLALSAFGMVSIALAGFGGAFATWVAAAAVVLGFASVSVYHCFLSHTGSKKE